MPENPNFIPGKAYRRRDGRKAIFVGNVPDVALPAVFFTADDSVSLRTRYPSGRFALSMEGPYDIIGEWREPITRTVILVLWESKTNPGSTWTTIYTPNERNVIECDKRLYNFLDMKEVTLTEQL